jgi:acylphosphatase
MSDDLLCRRIEFRGRVQGVGFRLTAARIARGFPIGGTVRNCRDGSVELIAVGSATAVNDYLAALRAAMQGNITDEQSSPGPDGFQADRFRIVH